MKVGDKYVVEIAEVIGRNGGKQIAMIKGFNTLVFDKSGLEKLEPYELAEDTAYQKGYNDCERVMDRKTTEVYNKGYEDGKNAVINESEKITSKDIADAHDKGLNEAWNLVRRIESIPDKGGLTNKQIEEVFGRYRTSFSLYNEFSAKEAIDRYRQWEDKQKQDTEIKVGDEVVCGDAYVVVTYISPEGEWDGFLLNDEHGKHGQGYTCMSDFRGWRKTGRRFSQIIEILSKLWRDEE